MDKAHFAAARGGMPEPCGSGRPAASRDLGFYGVIDERLDVDLLAAIADAHPEWSHCRGRAGGEDRSRDACRSRANLHFLGGKSYAELPSLSGGLGCSVDAVRHQRCDAVHQPDQDAGIPRRPDDRWSPRRSATSSGIGARRPGVIVSPARRRAFIAGCEDGSGARPRRRGTWLPAVDAALADLSWDKTFDAMAAVRRRRQVGKTAESSTLPTKATRPTGKPYDYLIVGAGLRRRGARRAPRRAGSGKRVLLVIDRRPACRRQRLRPPHDEAGLMVHKYGPHIFHTNSTDIADYLSRFTAWRPYEHRVLA